MPVAEDVGAGHGCRQGVTVPPKDAVVEPVECYVCRYTTPSCAALAGTTVAGVHISSGLYLFM